MGNPKYSVIIPVKNGMPYLETAVSSVLSQKFKDFELILSVDESQDSSWDFSQDIEDPRLQVHRPPIGLTMTEHWEWALSKASGDWLIFLGQDDALQLYFFDLAERLCDKAADHGVKIVGSRRAYLFWPGTEHLYPDQRFTYRAANISSIRSLPADVGSALTGTKTYFELPTMYTSSLFNKSILEFARAKQNGKVLTCHPQDANLAVVAFASETKYLRSEIPLGWVGTSTKSAGLAVAGITQKNLSTASAEVQALGQNYLDSIQSSSSVYDPRAGDFTIDDPKLYFWQALLKSKIILPEQFNRVIRKKKFKTKLFGAVWSNLPKNDTNETKKSLVQEAIKLNELSLSRVRAVAWIHSIQKRVRPVAVRLVWRFLVLFTKKMNDNTNFIEEVVSSSNTIQPSFDEFNSFIEIKYDAMMRIPSKTESNI